MSRRCKDCLGAGRPERARRNRPVRAHILYRALGAGIRLGCLTHIDAQRTMVEARADAVRLADLPVPPSTNSARTPSKRRSPSCSTSTTSRGCSPISSAKSGRCSVLLTPTEMERLTIYVAAELARKHKAKGCRSIIPRPLPTLSTRSWRARAKAARSPISSPGIDAARPPTTSCPASRDLMPMIQVEGTFPDGTKLVTVHDPIRPGKRSRAKATSSRARSSPTTATSSSTPAGARRRSRSSIPAIGPCKSAATIIFFETNKALDIRPGEDFGMHLDIPAGTSCASRQARRRRSC